MQKKALEITCYVAGGGAFGVFLRWLQVMIAFNEQGLVNKSAFNVLVPAFLIAAVAVFLRFLNQDDQRQLYVPEPFVPALKNDYKLFSILSWLAGGIVVIGALALLAKSETDKFVRFLRVLSAMGAVSGVTAPLLLELAHREEDRQSLICLVSLPPVIFFAAWLVYLYRINSINSVLWSYVPEMLTVSVVMFAFVRIAGFAFGAAKPRRARFDAMFGGLLCLMSLADDRYMGMQLMLLGTAMLLMLYNWAMVCNLRRGEPKPTAQPNDGFERLG